MFAQYVADRAFSRIKKVSGGQVVQWAGASVPLSSCAGSSADGAGTNALLGCVGFIAADASGNIFYPFSNRLFVVNASGFRYRVLGEPNGGTLPKPVYFGPYVTLASLGFAYQGYIAFANYTSPALSGVALAPLVVAPGSQFVFVACSANGAVVIRQAWRPYVFASISAPAS